jgi:hypothetical protein
MPKGAFRVNGYHGETRPDEKMGRRPNTGKDVIGLFTGAARKVAKKRAAKKRRQRDSENVREETAGDC